MIPTVIGVAERESVVEKKIVKAAGAAFAIFPKEGIR